MANYRKAAGSEVVAKAGSLQDYGVGDVIAYHNDGLQYVKVDEHVENVKHGEPGFGGTIIAGSGKGRDVWGYDSQVVRVVERNS